MFGDVQNLQQPAPAHLPRPLTPTPLRAPAKDLTSPWTDAPFATVTSLRNPGALGVEQLEQHWSGVSRHASTFTNIARLFLRRGRAGRVLSCDFPGIVGVGVGALSQPLETMSSSNVTNTLRPWSTLVSMENLATASSIVCKPPASSAPCVQMWGTGAASGPTVAVHPQSAARADARSPRSAPQHRDSSDPTFDFSQVYFLRRSCSSSGPS